MLTTDELAERRSGIDRRVYSYTRHIPERRKGIDRRKSKGVIKSMTTGDYNLGEPVKASHH